MTYSNFYIFYPPNYLCLDSNSGTYLCSKEIACSKGQKFIFEKSKINKKLKVLIIT